MSVVLTVVEHEGGELPESSLEALTFGRDLAEATAADLAAVAFGDGGAAIADAVGDYGVSHVHHVNHERLSGYAPAAWGAAIAQLAADHPTEAVVAPGSDRGQEALAHAGATLDVPMAANCSEVAVGDAYEVTRQRWGGSLRERARLDGDPSLVTVAEHEYGIEVATASTSPSVEEYVPELGDEHTRVTVDRVEEADVEGVPLGEARVVVSGGRGVGSAEDFDQLEELADLLGGTVGASRAAVNEGWRPHDDQVGLTGAKISPDIYIACGISGAVQHMVGCKGADNILAINTDPDAAIIQQGEYAVIGDLHDVVPALNDAIRELE